MRQLSDVFNVYKVLSFELRKNCISFILLAAIAFCFTSTVVAQRIFDYGIVILRYELQVYAGVDLARTRFGATINTIRDKFSISCSIIKR